MLQTFKVNLAQSDSASLSIADIQNLFVHTGGIFTNNVNKSTVTRKVFEKRYVL